VCAWDAKVGRFDFYLNGVLQEEIRSKDARRPWKFKSVYLLSISGRS
jgi:hypothetical protein